MVSYSGLEGRGEGLEAAGTMGGGEAAMPRVLLALPTAAASTSPISVGADAAAVILLL